MRNRLLSLLLTFLALVLPGSISTAQALDIGSTPEAIASPSGARGESGTGVPNFGIVTVGDHPTGYFNDIEVAPGASVELTAAIVNHGESTVSLRAFKVNALSAVNGGFLAGEEGDEPMGATAWIDFPAFDLELQPGQEEQVTFSVTVPEGTPAGQYLAGIFARTTDAVPLQGAEFLTQTRGYVISVGILVPGEITRDFTLGEPEVQDGMLSIPIANTGQYLVRPAGELTLTNTDGEVIHTSVIEMGSVYADVETTIQLPLPGQIAPGNYTLNLALVDGASGASDSLTDVVVTIPETVEQGELGVSVEIAANADPIAYANVTADFVNAGPEIPAAAVTLIVLRDGVEVESFPLESFLPLPNGETELTARYIPADDWDPGTYAFQLEVSSVDRRGEDETVLLIEDVSDTIVVP